MSHSVKIFSYDILSYGSKKTDSISIFFNIESVENLENHEIFFKYGEVLVSLRV